MKKIFTKVIAAGLALTIAFSCVACSDCSNCGKKESEISHEYEVGETEHYLIEKAKSDYKIVISDEADNNEKTGAMEIQYFFKEASEITLPIVEDSQIAENEEKIISVGNTDFSKKAGVRADSAAIKAQGYVIKTDGKAVYVVGKTTLGTLYGAYDFLNYQIGFDYYFKDVYSFDCDAANLKLKEFNLTESPDIDEFTTPSGGLTYYDSVEARRMRVTAIKDWLLPINTAHISVHNVNLLLPPAEFKESHPKWYAADGQLCFTAHGDEEEYKEFFEEIVKVIKKGLKESDANIFSISQLDVNTFCTCESCVEASNKYGANSSVLVLLLNELSDYFNEWFENDDEAEGGKQYKRDLKLVFLAYQQVLDAPVTKDAKTGEYVASAPEMVCRDNVGIYFAADGYHYTYGTDSENNAPIFESLKAWRALTDNFLFWLYDVNFSNYFYPYDSSYAKVEWYKFLNDCGTLVLNDQSQLQNKNGGTAWTNLKNYLNAKLRWNVNANLDELTKKFFKACYKDCSEEMYSVYIQFKAHAAEMKEKAENNQYTNAKIGTIGSIYGQLADKELWSKALVESWYKTFAKAYEKAAELSKTDARYERVTFMIAQELVSPLYMMIALYGDEYSSQDLDAYKAEFKAKCTEGKIVAYYDSEINGTIEKLYAALGIE